MNFRKLSGFVMTGVLAAGMCAMAQDSAKQDMKAAGHDTSAAARNTGHATKHVAKKTWHGTKHVAHKTKAATENTGDRIAGKPPVHQ